MRQIVLLALALSARTLLGCDTPHGIALSDLHIVPDCDFSQAVIAANDGGAFAAWHFSHTGFDLITTGTNYGAALDARGAMRHQAERQLGGGTAVPSVATDGRDFLLVLSDTNATTAQVVHADGTAEPSRLIANNHRKGRALVVWTGSEYLIVTPDLVPSDATLAALAPAGAGRALAILQRGSAFEADVMIGTSIVSTTPLPAIPPGTPVSAAWNGAGFAVAFFSNAHVTVLRLDGNGAPAGDPMGVADESPTFFTGPQVVAEGNDFLIIWPGATIRAARLTSSGLQPSFDVAAGVLWSAASSGGSTFVAYGAACSSIATRVIARNVGDETIVSLRPSVQSNPLVAATSAGHQALWFEGNDLFTRFVAGGEVRRLSDGLSFTAAIAEFAGGSIVVWQDDSKLRSERFSAAGDPAGEVKTIPSTKFIFSISLSVVNEEVLVVTQGENDSFKYEVDAVRVDASGNTLQRVVLSNPGEDGFDAVAGGDGAHWLAAWRNGSTNVVSIEMPRGDLSQMSRTSTIVTTVGNAYLGGITAGDDPAVVWTDIASPHALFIRSQLDVLLSNSNAVSVRVIDDEAFWIASGATTRVLSAPLSHQTTTPRERACLGTTGLTFDYDVRNHEVDAVMYADGPQLRIQPRSMPRRRAVR